MSSTFISYTITQLYNLLLFLNFQCYNNHKCSNICFQCGFNSIFNNKHLCLVYSINGKPSKICPFEPLAQPKIKIFKFFISNYVTRTCFKVYIYTHDLNHFIYIFLKPESGKIKIKLD